MKETTCNIKIHNIEWIINFVDSDSKYLLIENGDSRCGITSYVDKQIYIDKNLKDVTFTEVLLHELTHAFIESYGLLQFEWQDENVADFISHYSLEIIQKYLQVIENITKRETDIEKFEKLREKLEVEDK